MPHGVKTVPRRNVQLATISWHSLAVDCLRSLEETLQSFPYLATARRLIVILRQAPSSPGCFLHPHQYFSTYRILQQLTNIRWGPTVKNVSISGLFVSSACVAALACSSTSLCGVETHQHVSWVQGSEKTQPSYRHSTCECGCTPCSVYSSTPILK